MCNISRICMIYLAFISAPNLRKLDIVVTGRKMISIYEANFMKYGITSASIVIMPFLITSAILYKINFAQNLPQNLQCNLLKYSITH